MIWVYNCKECLTKIERLERGKRRRPNPKCHLCGKKMEWVKCPGSNFELIGKGWSK